MSTTEVNAIYIPPEIKVEKICKEENIEEIETIQSDEDHKYSFDVWPSAIQNNADYKCDCGFTTFTYSDYTEHVEHCSYGEEIDIEVGSLEDIKHESSISQDNEPNYFKYTPLNNVCDNIEEIIVYECNFCDRKFPTSKSLSKHQNSHCSAKSRFCNICSKLLSTSGNYKKHLRIHSNDRKYTCDICNKGFTRPDHLKNHKMIHSNKKSFQCNICDKSFAQHGNLVLHMKIHAGKQHKCHICNKFFSRADNLVCHLRIHTGEKPYECDECGRKFRYHSDVKKHERTCSIKKM